MAISNEGVGANPLTGIIVGVNAPISVKPKGGGGEPTGI